MNNQLLKPNLVSDETTVYLSIEDYAKAQGLSIKQVWDFIEEGLILAKNINHVIYIQQPNKNNVAKTNSPKTSLPAIQQNDLRYIDEGSDLNQNNSATTKQYLVDAANRIDKHMNMLEKKLISAKDTLLQEKDARIDLLREKLVEKDREVRTLKKKLEDMETLHFAQKYQANPEVFK